MTIALWLALFVLQCIDIWSTWYALKNIKGAYEKNPVIRWTFNHFGVLPSLIAIKCLMMVAIWLLSAPIEVLVLIVLMYVWVAFNNLRVINDN